MLWILEKVCGVDLFYVRDELYHLPPCEDDGPMKFVEEEYGAELKSLCR